MDIYYYDYPTKPIGGGNPYYCCAFCGRSDPEINGRLDKHDINCEYRRNGGKTNEQRKEELEAELAALKQAFEEYKKSNGS